LQPALLTGGVEKVPGRDDRIHEAARERLLDSGGHVVDERDATHCAATVLAREEIAVVKLDPCPWKLRRYAHEPTQITRRPDEAPDVRKALLE
jgi:hypothetical protein